LPGVTFNILFSVLKNNDLLQKAAENISFQLIDKIKKCIGESNVSDATRASAATLESLERTPLLIDFPTRGLIGDSDIPVEVVDSWLKYGFETPPVERDVSLFTTMLNLQRSSVYLRIFAEPVFFGHCRRFLGVEVDDIVIATFIKVFDGVKMRSCKITCLNGKVTIGTKLLGSWGSPSVVKECRRFEFIEIISDTFSDEACNFMKALYEFGIEFSFSLSANKNLDTQDLKRKPSNSKTPPI